MLRRYRAASPIGTLTRGKCRASVPSYPVVVAALTDTDAQDDWTIRFIQEIEDWVRECCQRGPVCSGVEAATSGADTLAQQMAPNDLPR